jgi:hypothetical protein
MDHADEIPCSTCKSWNGKQKKFSCNPKKCSNVSAWLLEHNPQISDEMVHMQVQLPEVTVQYIV